MSGSMSGARSGTTLSPELRLEAAAELARVAGRTALEFYGRGVTVEWKGDGSPVTAADRAAERAAREWIASRFPDDGVLGEEYGLERAMAPARWVLDPIDGTKSFVRQVPLWGTLVALCRGTEVLAGAAFFPVVDELLVAVPGAGAWWNGTRASVSPVSRVEQATVLTTDERFAGDPGLGARWRALAERAAVSRTWGDCFGYLLVATGRAEVMTDPRMSAWDSAALQPIITEAGGVFTDWTGAPTAFGGSAIATNAALAREARMLLGVSEGMDASG